MKNVNIEKKKRIVFVVEDLEKSAADFGIKRRVLDSLRDIRQNMQLAATQDEWDRQVLELDEWVKGLKKQVLPDEEERLALKDAEKRVQEILNQCGKLNGFIRSSYAGKQQLYLQETEREMRGMANAEANFETVTSASVFYGRINQIGQKFNMLMTETACEYIDEASENYGNAMQRIKRALKETGCNNLGPSEREFYYRWVDQAEQIKLGQKANAEKTEKGECVIGGFAQEHAKKVQKIIARENRNCLMIKLFPVFLVLLFFAFLGVSKARQAMPKSEVQVEAAGEGAKTNGKLEIPYNKVLEKVVETYGLETVLKNSLIFLVEFVMLLLLSWRLAAKCVNKRYKKRVCEKAGRYLAK